jgi:Ser/Thr protein kinase RdoA (MazF antagonist)
MTVARVGVVVKTPTGLSWSGKNLLHRRKIELPALMSAKRMMNPERPNATRIDKRKLAAALERFYGLSVVRVVPMRTVCGVLTTTGERWIWKCVRRQSVIPLRLQVQTSVAAALQQQGIVAPMPTRNRHGEWVTQIGTDLGYLQPWVSGRHVNLGDPSERLRAVATLAAFHSVAGRLLLHPRPDLMRPPLCAKLAMKRDFLYAKWDQVTACCPEAKSQAEALFSAADLAVHAARRVHILRYAHRDMAPHNLLLQADGNVALIDFDEAGFDDPLVDILQCTNHGIHFGGLGAGYFCDILEAYRRNCPMDGERERALWAMFGFPELLYRAVLEWMREGHADGDQRLEEALTLERMRRQVLTQERTTSGGHSR